jgi:putative ABC transport system substrate-binding protein
VRAALEQGAKVLGPGSWGLLYDPQEGAAADLARMFTTQAPRFGIKALTETGTDAATDRRGLQRLLDRGARVIYLPPTAGARRYAPLLLSWGREGKVLVVSGQPEGPHQGAVLRVALDYHRLGQDLAVLAQRVLAGEAPARIPISSATPVRVEWDEALLKRWSGYPPPPRVKR